MSRVDETNFYKFLKISVNTGWATKKPLIDPTIRWTGKKNPEAGPQKKPQNHFHQKKVRFRWDSVSRSPGLQYRLYSVPVKVNLKLEGET